MLLSYKDSSRELQLNFKLFIFELPLKQGILPPAQGYFKSGLKITCSELKSLSSKATTSATNSFKRSYKISHPQ